MDQLGWYVEERWYIDLHAGKEKPERETHCDECQAIKDYGIDACQGCAG